MYYQEMWHELYDFLLSETENVKFNMDVIRKMRTIRDAHFGLVGSGSATAKNPPTASSMGKKGGSAKTKAKSSASRENGKKGGRPKKAMAQAGKEGK